MYLSVIIPAKNEEKHIKNTVQSVNDYLSQKGFEYEIIVVSNKSNDATVSIVKELMHQISTLRILDYPNNGGKGFAVREGMLHAAGEYRLFMDADNSTKIDNIDKALPFFKEGYDVAIASIRVKGHEIVGTGEPWYRRSLGLVSSWYSQIVLLPGILDTQRGFKIVTAKAAQDIFSIMRITQFGFDMEMLALARKFGYKIKEFPIKWQNDPNTASHPRLSSYVQVLLDTLKIKWWLLTGSYSRGTILKEKA